MSAATEFAPAVFIPAPARRGTALDAPERLASVSVLHAPREVDLAVAPLRLTRRGVVVLTVAVAVLAGALLWLAARSAPAEVAGPATPHAVTVQAGDTLWSISARVAPQRDPRAEVAELQRVNKLSGPYLTPGQTLRVP